MTFLTTPSAPSSASVTPLQSSSLAGSERISRWQSLSWMVGVALAFRIFLILLYGSYHVIDKVHGFGYETGSIARSLAAGEGFSSPFLEPSGPTAWIGPVYPFFCSLVFRIFGIFTAASAFVILSFNSLLAALTCIPIVRIAERCFTCRLGLWAGWLWAVVPFFCRWPTTWVWDIALSAFLLTMLFSWVLSLESEVRARYWLRFGVFWGFSALANPALLSFLPFSFAWSSYCLFRQGKPFLRNVILSGLVCLAVVSPWMIRNRYIFGQWVFLRGNFGMELRLGNYHGSMGFGWGGPHPTRNPKQLALYKKLGEVAYVKMMQQQAMIWIRGNPAEFLTLSAKRILYFWDGESVLYNIPSQEPWVPWQMALLSVTTAFGLLLALEKRKRAAWLFAIVLLVYPMPYYITYAMARYRHAIEPLMLILSLYFVDVFARKLMEFFKGRKVLGVR